MAPNSTNPAISSNKGKGKPPAVPVSMTPSATAPGGPARLSIPANVTSSMGAIPGASNTSATVPAAGSTMVPSAAPAANHSTTSALQRATVFVQSRTVGGLPNAASIAAGNQTRQFGTAASRLDAFDRDHSNDFTVDTFARLHHINEYEMERVTKTIDELLGKEQDIEQARKDDARRVELLKNVKKAQQIVDKEIKGLKSILLDKPGESAEKRKVFNDMIAKLVPPTKDQINRVELMVAGELTRLTQVNLSLAAELGATNNNLGNSDAKKSMMEDLKNLLDGEKKYAALHNQLTSARHEFEMEELKHNQTKKEMKSLEREVAQLHDKTKRFDAQAATIVKLSSERDQILQELETAQETENSALVGRLAMEEQLRELKDELKTEQIKVVSKDGEITTTRHELQAAHRSVETRDGKISILEKQLQIEIDARATLSEDHVTAKREIEAEKKRIVAKESEITTTRQELQAASRAVETRDGRISALEQKLQIEIDARSNLREDIAVAKKEAETERKKVSIKDSEIEAVRQELLSSQQTLAEDRGVISALRERIDAETVARAALREDIATVKKEVESERNRVSAKDSEIGSIRKEILSRQQTSAEDKGVMSTLEQQVKLQKSVVAELEARIAILRDELQQAKKEVQLKKTNASAQNARIQELIAIWGAAIEATSAEKQKVLTRDQKIHVLESEISNLQKALSDQKEATAAIERNSDKSHLYTTDSDAGSPKRSFTWLSDQNRHYKKTIQELEERIKGLPTPEVLSEVKENESRAAKTLVEERRIWARAHRGLEADRDSQKLRADALEEELRKLKETMASSRRCDDANLRQDLPFTMPRPRQESASGTPLRHDDGMPGRSGFGPDAFSSRQSILLQDDGQPGRSDFVPGVARPQVQDEVLIDPALTEHARQAVAVPTVIVPAVTVPAPTVGAVQFNFLTAGTPEAGLTTLNVAPKLITIMNEQIKAWEEKKSGAWLVRSGNSAKRCVETRLNRVSKDANPLPNDPHHSFACSRCIRRRMLCVMIGVGWGPVVVPLPVEERAAILTSQDEGYYIREMS